MAKKDEIEEDLETDPDELQEALEGLTSLEED